jgi:DNA-binding transcriptional LysR family regulator
MSAFSRFLRYFTAVGQAGSIRRAAELLNVSASAIDRQILNVEADLDMPLFERLPSGLRLTAAGEIMMAAGARWQKEEGEVRSRIADLRGLRRGHVEIAIIDALAKGYMPGIIHRILKRHPGITIGIKVLSNEAVGAAILSGEVDFGVFFEPQSFRGLTVRAFVEVELGLVTLPDHPLAARAQLRFSHCADLPLIVPGEPLAVSQQIAVIEGVSGLGLNKVVVSDHIQLIASLVAEGAGVGILTSLDVHTEVKRGLLAFTPIFDPILRPMILALATSSARTPSYAAGMILREIEDGFAEVNLPAG